MFVKYFAGAWTDGMGNARRGPEFPGLRRYRARESYIVRMELHELYTRDCTLYSTGTKSVSVWGLL